MDDNDYDNNDDDDDDDDCFFYIRYTHRFINDIDNKIFLQDKVYPVF